MGDLTDDVRTNLRAIRKERGYTQEELSDRSDLAPKNVGKIERGQKTFSVEDLLKLAVELETRVSDFFVKNGQPEEHARSLERQTYDLGSLIESSEDEDPVPDIDALFNTSSALLVLLDEAGNLLRANRFYEKITGSQLETNQDTPFWECPLWFGANERRMKHLIDEAREGQFLREVLPVRTDSGTTTPYKISVCPVRALDGEERQFLVEGVKF